jgi:plastocyanin
MASRITATATVLAAVAILIAPACGKSNVSKESNASSAPASASSPSTAPAPGAATAATITINDFKYTDVTVPAGSQVTVVNNDSAEHTVTSDTPGAFNVEIAGKHQATLTAPGQPGTYPFHCTYHPSMHGVLTVQ